MLVFASGVGTSEAWHRNVTCCYLQKVFPQDMGAAQACYRKVCVWLCV
jgi:hypothetical protein